MLATRRFTFLCAACLFNLPATFSHIACATEPDPLRGPIPAAEVAPAPREPTDWSYCGPDRSSARVRAAHQAKDGVVRQLLRDAGLLQPVHDLLFLVYKEEGELEVWANDNPHDPLVHVATYVICSASGGSGPKRREGDFQVPEGFYTLDAYNRHSSFYLSMRISYPNASDRILGHRGKLGGAIMIHGNCVSIGCLAMSDERIQELWVLADGVRRARRRVRVYSFPGRDMARLIANEGNVERRAFWENLKEGWDWFAEHGTLPRIRVDRAGRYEFSEPR